MNNRYLSFELLLISTWFLGVMAVKFILPSLPGIAEQLHTTPTMAKYTISLFLLGKASGMLVFGPLSEKYGRKIFMLIGLALFSLGNFFASFTTSIELLLFARLLQGIGVSATVMVGRAMVNDSYKHTRAAVVFSHVFLAASVIIAFIPMLGSLVATHYHWQTAFMIMALYSAVIFAFCAFMLKETHIPSSNAPFSMSKTVAYYKMITSHPVFLGYVLCSIFMIAGESAFNTASSFLLIKSYGVSKNMFGMLITCLAIGHLIGTLICGRLVKRYDLVNIMGSGVIMLAASSIIMATLISLGYANVAVIIIPMIVFYIGTGFIMTITAVGTVIPFPTLIGMSSAASLSLNFSLSALSSAVISNLPTSTARPVSLLICACGVGSLLSWYLLIMPNRVTNSEYTAAKAI